jgi:hypothetical protein
VRFLGRVVQLQCFLCCDLALRQGYFWIEQSPTEPAA